LCQCGPQLRAALAQISAAGAGILLYLAQEGRGIGMANKLRAYALQDQGYDTVDANHRLGVEDDERDFKVAALMLESLGFNAVEVMTNNPRKTDAFERNGIRVVARVPLAVGRTEQNTDYLDTKAARSGHLL
jgi:GTP cyclohydrolase II